MSKPLDYQIEPDLEDCPWGEVRHRMYAQHLSEAKENRDGLRQLLSDYFGGKVPNLKASRLKKILKLYGIREKMPVWDCVKAILFYSVIISGMILLFGGLCYVMHGISMYPGW